MPTRSAPLRILILATVERDRLAIEQELKRRANLDTSDIRHHAQLEPALNWTIRERWIPELVVMASGYPQVWSEDEFVELWNALPLARWIVVNDGWSSSVLRHLPWIPPTCCIPRERFSHRLRQELLVLDGSQLAHPLTDSLDELFLRDAELPSDLSLSGLRTGVLSPDREFKLWIKEMLELFGATIVTLEQGPSAVLWDLDPWNDDRKTQLEVYRRRDPDCLIVGLRNTVHELSTLEAEQHGVDLLVPKQLGTSAILEAFATIHS